MCTSSFSNSKSHSWCLSPDITVSSILLEFSELSEGTFSSTPPSSSLSEVRPSLSSILGRDAALGDRSLKMSMWDSRFKIKLLIHVGLINQRKLGNYMSRLI